MKKGLLIVLILLISTLSACENTVNDIELTDIKVVFDESTVVPKEVII